MRRWVAAGTAVAIILAVGVLLAVSTTHNATPARGAATATSITPASSTSAPPVPPRSAASTTQGSDVVPPGAWALPPPKRYVGTVGVGFPHTPLGAIAMGYGSLAGQVTVDPDIAASVVRATYLSPRPDQIAEAAQIVEQARTSYGLSPTGPTSTTIALSIEACRTESAGASRVVAGYEGTLVVEGPTIQGVTSNFSKAITLVWNGSDWRIDPNSPDAQPPIAFPGDAQSAADGWHACSEV